MSEPCIGFTTTKGLMLDIDHCRIHKVKNIAKTLMKVYKLEGYLIIKSSKDNYHIVFNKYLTWKKITKILFNQYICIRWAIWQMRKGELTLRISRKNGKNKPKIIITTGKTDKLINDYLTIYNQFEEY